MSLYLKKVIATSETLAKGPIAGNARDTEKPPVATKITELKTETHRRFSITRAVRWVARHLAPSHKTEKSTPAPKQPEQVDWVKYMKAYATVMPRITPYRTMMHRVAKSVAVEAKAIAESGQPVRVLDLGCGPAVGSAMVLDALAQRKIGVDHFRGLEYSGAAVETARHTLSTANVKADVQQADLTQDRLGLSEAEWAKAQKTPSNIIVMTNVLYIISPERRAEMFAQIRKIATPDAVIVIADPNRAPSKAFQLKAAAQHFGSCLRNLVFGNAAQIAKGMDRLTTAFSSDARYMREVNARELSDTTSHTYMDIASRNAHLAGHGLEPVLGTHHTTYSGGVEAQTYRLNGGKAPFPADVTFEWDTPEAVTFIHTGSRAQTVH